MDLPVKSRSNRLQELFLRRLSGSSIQYGNTGSWPGADVQNNSFTTVSERFEASVGNSSCDHLAPKISVGCQKGAPLMWIYELKNRFHNSDLSLTSRERIAFRLT